MKEISKKICEIYEILSKLENKELEKELKDKIIELWELIQNESTLYTTVRKN